MGVETGGCPHTAIREDASMNLAAIEDMNRKFPHAELCFVESGGDNLAATFSPELADFTIYVIDVAEGEKIPRKRVELMLIESFEIGRLDFLIVILSNLLIVFCLTSIRPQKSVINCR